MIDGKARANPANTARFGRMRSRITDMQDMTHGNLNLRVSQLAAGHRRTASMAEKVTGMKIEWPRYRATATPSRARTFSPIRVAEDRLRFMRTRVARGCRGPTPVSSHHRGPERVVQQHGDRHRPDPPGDRGQPAGHRLHGRGVHVADELAVDRV